MYKIQTLNTISATGLNQFPRDFYEVSADITQPDAILLRSFDLHSSTIPETVKAVGRAGVGTNNIPIAALTQRGIAVFNTPGANANAVRELVIAGMLLASRNICQAWNYVLQLKTTDQAFDQEIEQNKIQFAGFELLGKTIGIVGLGSIGVKVANAAVSLGMNVIGYDPTITVNRAWELSANVKQAHSIEDLLTKADFVTLHVPLNEATKNMINAARIQIMKPDVVLLNFARIGIIDEAALSVALNEKKIHAYVTDFPRAELKNHPRVISLPHLGASTREAEENCAFMIAMQVRNFLENGSITNAINLPHLDLPHINSGVRLAIVNANIPNMVAQISGKLASASLNIASLFNKSLGDVAYTVIDVNQNVTTPVLEQIKSIEGVIQLRQLQPHPAE